MNLCDLTPGVIARVTAISAADPLVEAKLREIGFSETDEVELTHKGPLSGKPLCIRLNRTLIALRAEEAAAITVEPCS